jgi:hypothetical protein
VVRAHSQWISKIAFFLSREFCHPGRICSAHGAASDVIGIIVVLGVAEPFAIATILDTPVAILFDTLSAVCDLFVAYS